MQRGFLTILLSVTLALGASAQLSLEELIPGGKNFYNYYPFGINADFRGETNELVIQRNDSVFNQPIGKTSQLLMDLKGLNEILESRQLTALKRLPRLKWISKNEIRFQTQLTIITVDIDQKAVTALVKLPEGALNTDYSIENGQVAFTKGNDLYVVSGEQEPVLVGSDKADHIVFGQTVHRNEFGISKGTFWSPNGKYLAFYRKDESMVSDYPLVNVEKRVAELENIKYPMAGMKSHEVTVGVYDVTKKSIIYLKTGEPADRFFTNIAWTPDEQYILIAELNREQNHMHLNKYDAKTGELVKTLFEEQDEHWVEPQHAALFIPGRSDQFIWQSVRDGYNHLYVYDLEGNVKRQLTAGSWEVTSVLGFDSKAKALFIESTKESALERHVYKVNMANGKMVKLTHEPGVHRVKVSADGRYALTTWSSVSVPSKTCLLNSKGQCVKELHAAENPYKDVEIGKIDLVTLKTADGKTDLHGRVILPTNFDPSKKYPVIVYVYGGPHSQLVQNRWLGAARTWQLYMAQKGYIAFTLDNRGTTGRGKAFEQAIHRQVGTLEVEDQMQGVEYLKSLPYVDQERIGVHGWSYGGFMTISMMLQQSDVFKVGVAGGPVIDWKYYEIMYGERYMDMPQENPAGYEKNNLNNQAKNLKGRLMVIHGAIDPVVVWQHSLSFLRECVKSEVQVDYFAYPRHEHNVRGRDRVHLMEKVSRYFEDFL